MKNLPLVANKQGICSRNINIHVIWVWAENTVNSGVLLHLHHQTLQFFGEPPVPTVKCYSNFCTKICVVLPLSLHWTYDISEIHGFRWCSTQVSPDSPGCVRNPKSHTLGPPPKKCGLRKNGAQFFCCCKTKANMFVLVELYTYSETNKTPSTVCDCVLLGFSAAGQMIWQLEIPRLGSMESWWAFCLLQAGVSMRTGIFIVIWKVGITPC